MKPMTLAAAGLQHYRKARRQYFLLRWNRWFRGRR
jgi:hypothetical protein